MIFYGILLSFQCLFVGEIVSLFSISKLFEDTHINVQYKYRDGNKIKCFN